MPVEMTLAELEAAKDVDLGAGEWKTVEQKHIDLFADATGDHQWIHVDPERAANESPIGTTIAHGYLTLSLLPAALYEMLTVTDAKMGINYGTDKIRFLNPVPTGSQVRVKARVAEAQRKGDGILYKLAVEVEIKDNPKPALVGEVLYMAF